MIPQSLIIEFALQILLRADKNNKINNYVESNSGCSLNDIHLNIKKEISKTSVINIRYVYN